MKLTGLALLCLFLCCQSCACLRSDLTGGSAEVSLKDGILRLDDWRVLYCKRYYHGLQKMEGVIFYDYGGNGGDDAAYIEASAATWNPEKEDWELVDGRRVVGDITEPCDHLGVKGVTPELLWQSGKAERERSSARRRSR